MNSKHITRFSGALLLATAISACLQPASVLASDAPKAQPVDGKIKWVYDYQEGQRVSQETGKPMFVVFRCER